MRPPTDKPVCAIRWEGCIEGEDGLPIDGAVEKTQVLAAEGFYIILVSHKTQSIVGKQLLMQQIIMFGPSYDEVWESNGLPEVDQWFDNLAEGF